MIILTLENKQLQYKQGHQEKKIMMEEVERA